MSKLNNRDFIIQARKGTAAELTAYSGLLYEGEFAYATDTNLLYVGNASGVPQLIGPTAGSSIAIGGSAITGGTTKRVLYDLAGVVQEAANFTIESGNPNVTAGNSYKYNGVTVFQADTGLNNWFSGNSGNLTATGANNSGFGASALSSVTSGNANLAIGTNALANNNTGANNMALGAFALAANTSGLSNVAVGANTLQQNTTGQQNTALGTLSLFGLQDGNFNIGIGGQALLGGVHNTGCIGIGYGTLTGATADYNTAVGMQAGTDLTSGATNTFVGKYAGNGITTGSNNTVIGSAAGLSAGLANNVILADGAGNKVLWYDGSNVIALKDSVELTEMTAPSAPASNKCRVFSQDNGSGKTQLCVRFPTGATQVIATEP